jgi:hypothetical protein
LLIGLILVSPLPPELQIQPSGSCFEPLRAGSGGWVAPFVLVWALADCVVVLLGLFMLAVECAWDVLFGLRRGCGAGQSLDPFGPAMGSALQLVGSGSVWAGSGVTPLSGLPVAGCALEVLTGLLRGSFRRGASVGRGLLAAESVRVGSGAVPSLSAPSSSAAPGVWRVAIFRSSFRDGRPCAGGAWLGCFWAVLVGGVVMAVWSVLKQRSPWLRVQFFARQQRCCTTSLACLSGGRHGGGRVWGCVCP